MRCGGGGEGFVNDFISEDDFFCVKGVFEFFGIEF